MWVPARTTTLGSVEQEFRRRSAMSDLIDIGYPEQPASVGATT
jgi:hypothetical protein